jgi:hypothetical protein
LWVRRYAGPGSDVDEANSMAVSQQTGTVFVTGSSQGSSGEDALTIAYNG